MVSEPKTIAGERVKERIARLETLLGEWPKEEETMTAFADSFRNKFKVQRKLMESSDQYMRED